MELPQHWPLPDATGLRDDLLAAYGEPTRRYHDARHLSEVLDRLAELRQGGVDFDDLPVTLAAWFHDAVYDCERDAEERSAVWAEDGLDGLVRNRVRREVARLVRLTETHEPAEDDVNGCALSDADLGILAAKPKRYESYRQAVRAEFAHVSDDDFRDGRTQVLRHLLGKPTLFHTEQARAAWEAPARANVERELAELAASAPPEPAGAGKRRRR